MSWLTNVVRPKLRELVGARREIPENLWHTCPSCAQMIFHRDLQKNLHVCQHCGHHMRLAADERVTSLLDPGWRTLEVAKTPVDPLKFRDLKRYGDRLKDAQGKTGRSEAILVATGTMGAGTDGEAGAAASPEAEAPDGGEREGPEGVVLAVLDFAFMGGSMGVAVGEGLLTAARAAVAERKALVVVVSSGGARMQEGILSLMQMARSTIAVEEVRAAGLPYVVVLADPTTGGVSASFAMLGDVTIAEPGAVIGFAGARVIEQTIRESLPDGFQRAEYLLDHGIIDMVVPRGDLRATLIRVLGLLRRPLRTSLETAVVPVTPPEPEEEAGDRAVV